jgi:hypothetical protein
MLEMLIYLLYGYGMFKLGKLVQQIETRAMFRRTLKAHNINLDEILQQVYDENNTEFILIRTETINEIILLYNADTDEFLGQATSLEEAAKIFHQRMQNATGEVIHNDDKFYFVDGKITKTI